MSLVVIDFTSLKGGIMKLWLKSWRLLTLVVIGSRHMSLRGHTVGKKYLCLTLDIITLLTTVVTGMMAMLCIQSWKLCYIRELSSAVAIFCFGHQKINFISGLNDRIVIDNTQLGCHELADSVPTIHCTFACHKSKRVCALRTAYSLAQWLNYYIVSLQYAKCPPQPG
jgi:hypothetical protein